MWNLGEGGSPTRLIHAEDLSLSLSVYIYIYICISV